AEMGVRFNDFGTFARANRFTRQEREAMQPANNARA
ncbi:fatty acid desaturase, partial [Pseudomonas protegens]|nr:fatty acid desaturase [Pseudomonas protegens]